MSIVVTFEELVDVLDGTSAEGNPELVSVDEPGEGAADVAELWFDGEGTSPHPVIVDESVARDVDAPSRLIVPNLSDQLTSILRCFAPDNPDYTGVSEDASISEDALIGDPVEVGPFTEIGSEVTLGDRVSIGSGVTIEGPAEIADGVEIGHGVRIVSPVDIGENTVIHANTVIGTDGYGYEQTAQGHEKIPQIGRVKIGADVEIGAGVAIDRATFGSTVIGKGSKLDNHVHVAHNCKIGENCLMVAKSGLAGSVTLGDGVILAGMAAVEDHNELADNVIVAAKSGVTKDVTEEGTIVSGFPARQHEERLKIQALQRKLPQIRQDVIDLKQTLDNEE
jgi:UDP-3-O-[3-hydroxymyristoyl] glucosamine N-acyltransferase